MCFNNMQNRAPMLEAGRRFILGFPKLVTPPALQVTAGTGL